MSTKVLIGAPVRQDATVLDAYVRSLRGLLMPRAVTADFAFVVDMAEHEDAEEAYKLLAPLGELLEADKRDARAVYAVDDVTHRWSTATFEHLAKQKQRLLDYARERGYTHFFLVDSDLLMEPTTLRSLLACEVPVVSAAFWTQWTPSDDPLPQCWLRNPYGLSGLGMQQHEFLGALARRELVRVIGGGACCLFRLDAPGRYWPRLEGLPEGGMWQGEDRTMSVLLQQARVGQYADGWPNVFHAYHPAQRRPEVLEAALEVLQAPRQQAATYGDLISIRLTPLQDAMLQENLDPRAACVRGRLGALGLAPELEADVLEMTPGQQRVVNIAFPPWSSLDTYRGSLRAVVLELVDARPYGHAPTLADWHYAEVEQ